MCKKKNDPNEDWIDDEEKPETDSSVSIDEIIDKHGKKRKLNRRRFDGYQNPGVDEID